MMADHSTCLNDACKAWADGSVAVCPRCGGPMRFKKGSTLRGWVLLFLGLFLVLMLGAITWNLAPSMLHPGKEIDGGTFNGTAEQARMFLGLFALIIAFGLTAAMNGAFIIATGRQSKVFTVISLAAAAVLVLAAVAVIGIPGAK
jgi:phosphate starvation-inducible membrane PsiE